MKVYPEQRLIIARFETASSAQALMMGPWTVAGIIVAAIAAFIAVALWRLEKVVETPAGKVITVALGVLSLAALIYAIRR